MIQQSKQLPVQPKAEKPRAERSENEKSNLLSTSKKAEGSKSVDKKEASAKTKEAENLDEQDFANELEASLADHSEVRQVKVQPEQAIAAPSLLIHPEITGEVASPKVFDPSLTKGVEGLINPQAEVQVDVPVMTDEQVLELAKLRPADAELLNQEIKTIQSGRAPAIELQKEEAIDPQLLNNEDFVAQKNLANKKPVAPANAYGLKNAAVKAAALEASLKTTEVVSDVNKADAAPKTINSQQFILDLQKDNGGPKLNEAVKVFDMNQVKSSDSNAIMNQITDYVVQAKAAKEPVVNMRVSHDELGMLDITVKKGIANEAVAISIGAHSNEGKNFFNVNSKDLISHLSTAGISVADFKVETLSQSAKSDFDMNQQQRGQDGQRQFGSEQNQRRHESDRRKELWDLLAKEAA